VLQERSLPLFEAVATPAGGSGGTPFDRERCAGLIFRRWCAPIAENS
jgi:hypothetical protein